MAFAKRKVFGDFTDKEMTFIALRTHGVKITAIVERMRISKTTAQQLQFSVYQKVGVDDVALLTRWAIENAVDEALDPERPEDLPPPEPKVHKGKIRLNRLPQMANKTGPWRGFTV